MMKSSATKVNPDLAKERGTASFNTTELTYLLHGGRQKTERKRFLESLLVKDPVFSKEDAYVLDRKHGYERSLQKGLRAVELAKEHHITDPDEMSMLEKLSGAIFPFHLSKVMFIPTLKGQGSEEQKAKWLPLAESYQIIGTYAQTELGHGTYVRGLETTATYDKTTQEIVIHSPSLSACKWWPGNLGKSSNFAIVPARLIVDKKDHGIQMFIVQLRDRQTHQPLPGITVGDIGAKFSTLMNGGDNGYLMFNHVRIPLNQMLMGLAKLSPDGIFTKPANPKLLYGTMSFVRAVIVRDSCWLLSRALTVAIRYSAVRRQSQLKPGEPESQIIAYKTQQYKLLPGLAMAYATKFTFDHVWRLYEEMQKKIAAGDFSMLPEVHAITSGLKAFSTSTSMRHTETCRLACGGHGYLLYSSLPELYTILNASCTYEGDNDVLYLQVARYLIKSASQVQEGKAPPLSLSFLSGKTELCPVKSGAGFLDPRVQRKIYQDRTSCEVMTVAERLQSRIFSGMDSADAWNEVSVDLVRCAKGYSNCVMVLYLLESMEKLSGVSSNLRRVLKSLADLFVLWGIAENSGSFLEAGVLDCGQIQIIRQQVYALMDQLRPEAVSLVDAFDYSDYVLNSPLGRLRWQRI
ncbi:Acyl-coenzyme A oxidase (Acyl-CoA oxidase) [Desmophyllum pertusum]|uniref:Acyl-coenzyme A oxidase n=1 Tax=Desmophyllum pertusum TaxID=174260 RepID=A0A9W9ZVL1_9CNID|nr:Acyl-coenzyme A oxidase (Acyl-CoA oxidase) [Desmophyllum pertusum]